MCPLGWKKVWWRLRPFHLPLKLTITVPLPSPMDVFSKAVIHCLLVLLESMLRIPSTKTHRVPLRVS